jgi:hypothetical protein
LTDNPTVKDYLTLQKEQSMGKEYTILQKNIHPIKEKSFYFGTNCPRCNHIIIKLEATWHSIYKTICENCSEKLTLSDSKKNKIFNKFNGRCAYTGTELLPDWQIDHVQPKSRKGTGDLENLFPAQRLINHYKNTFTLEEWRIWRLNKLHIRLTELPKNPRTEKGKKKKAYLLEVARMFGVTPDKPFKHFYFKKLNDTKNNIL